MTAATTDWLLGTWLILLTVTIHATGVVVLALAMIRVRVRLASRNLRVLYMMPCVIGVPGVTGLVLSVLHGLEAAIWAASYLQIDAFASAPDAILFSLGAMTTAGAPGLVLPRPWQIMGVRQRRAPVRYQHRLHLRGDAGLLAAAPPARLMGRRRPAQIAAGPNGRHARSGPTTPWRAWASDSCRGSAAAALRW